MRGYLIAAAGLCVVAYAMNAGLLPKPGNLEPAAKPPAVAPAEVAPEAAPAPAASESAPDTSESAHAPAAAQADPLAKAETEKVATPAAAEPVHPQKRRGKTPAAR